MEFQDTMLRWPCLKKNKRIRGYYRDVPENYQDITYSLKEHGGTTTFTVTQENCKTEELRDHSVKNWTSVLECMKDLFEKNEM